MVAFFYSDIENPGLLGALKAGPFGTVFFYLTAAEGTVIEYK
jgi:hypothetical protein